jgi:V/A-type H+/Na+-transporting ATPase subunit E
MEEIKGGGALEAEIREDARRKAERIIKQAEKDAEAARTEAEKSSRAEISSMEAAMGKRGEAYREEVLARLPLERKRVRLSWIEAALEKELGAAMDALGDEEAGDLVLSRLEPAAPSFKGTGASVQIRGLPSPSLRAAVSSLFDGASIEEGPAANRAERGIEVKSADGLLRFSSSLRDVFGEFADSRRGELARALVGGISTGEGGA